MLGSEHGVYGILQAWIAWKGGDGVTMCDYDEYRRDDKSTRLEAHMGCLKGAQ